MNQTTIIDPVLGHFESLLGVSIAVERTSEIIKGVYQQIRNRILKKDKTEEITKIEKEIISLVIGIFTCISIGYGVDIPAVDEPRLVQYLIAGSIAALGSNVIHATISLLIAIKNNIEEARKAVEDINKNKVEQK